MLRWLVLAWAVCLPVPLAAQDIAALNGQALSAFNAGDAAKALALTEDAVELGEARGVAEPLAYLDALNNLVFLMTREGGWPPGADALIASALSFAEAQQIENTPQWLSLAAYNARSLLARARAPDAHAQLRAILGQFRGTDLHGPAAGVVGDLYFAAARYSDMLLALQEMVAVGNLWQAQTDLDQLYQRQLELEQAGDVAGVTDLIDARILLVGLIAPADLATDFAHAALWTKFHMNLQAENFGAAADALRVWSGTGSMSTEERSFIDTYAAQALTLTQLEGYGTRTAAQLGFAELTVTLAELAYDPGDHRIGLALRERAAAETALGQHPRAAASLQDALAILQTSDEGRRSAFLVLDDLAANAGQREQLDLAERLYDRGEAAYRRALDAGAPPLSHFDMSVNAANRADVAIARRDVAAATVRLGAARAAWDLAKAGGGLKANQLWHEARLLSVAIRLFELEGRVNDAARAAHGMAEAARALYPPRHPDRALALSNAADSLFVLGEPGPAADYLGEAHDIAQYALPPDAPLLTEINVKRGLIALTGGDRAATISAFKAVAEARKSPRYRAGLPEAAGDFEVLSWALFTDGASRTDDALDALQWTQVSGSAEALAMMGARLSSADPAHALLIRQRQDLMIEQDRLRSSLLAAYASEEASGETIDTLIVQQNALFDQLKQLDADMASAGLELTGHGRIDPLSVSEMQALLHTDEVLVTFVLPGLRPELVEGLTGTSNLAIAISKDAVTVAPVRETSRGALNARIAAFRCEMAISDGGCGQGGARGLRGAMLAEDLAPDEPSFDWRVAHALYEDLFGGLGPVMAGHEHLIIVPPSDLMRLPFNALVTRPQPDFSLGTADWLIRSHAVSILPSIPALRMLRRTAPGAADLLRSMLGVGDPAIGAAPDADCQSLGLATLRSVGGSGGSFYNAAQDGQMPLADPGRLRGLSRLPDATCELRAIAASFGPEAAQLLLGADATETRIKALSASGGLAGYKVLVFATHGLVAGETSAVAPGLVLTPPDIASVDDDGLLTAAEVATLSLDADLVVLSACNTAAGDAVSEEGLSGLARGFFHAGARALMVTHWAVYSHAAVEVSTGLFAALQSDPHMAKADALRSAMMSILDDPVRGEFPKHPAYWAPFAIIGL